MIKFMLLIYLALITSNKYPYCSNSYSEGITCPHEIISLCEDETLPADLIITIQGISLT